MIADDSAGNGSVIPPEIQTTNCNVSAENFSCRLGAALIGPFCQHRSKPPACHRGKLSALIDDSRHRIGKIGASHPVHHNASHRQLSFIAFPSCFALNQRCQK